jgi:hypothetical protein
MSFWLLMRIPRCEKPECLVVLLFLSKLKPFSFVIASQAKQSLSDITRLPRTLRVLAMTGLSNISEKIA